MKTAAWAIAALALALGLLHGVASAGAGWYLLVPPVRGGEPLVAEKAPLGEWNQRRAFETVRECEAERTRIDKAAVAWLNSDGAHTESARVDNQGDQAAKFLFKVKVSERYADTVARCVASDDPRLR